MRRQKPRTYPIGGDHEIFNQLPSPVLKFLAYVNHLLPLKDRLGLESLKLESSQFVAALAQFLCDRILSSKLRIQP